MIFEYRMIVRHRNGINTRFQSGNKVNVRESFHSCEGRENISSSMSAPVPGIHGKFFQDNGLDVICIDLSFENGRRCREKGITTFMMDFLNLGFDDETFESIFAMNCLLHVPKRDLPRALESLRTKLIIGGLFYWG